MTGDLTDYQSEPRHGLVDGLLLCVCFSKIVYTLVGSTPVVIQIKLEFRSLGKKTAEQPWEQEPTANSLDGEYRNRTRFSEVGGECVTSVWL